MWLSATILRHYLHNSIQSLIIGGQPLSCIIGEASAPPPPGSQYTANFSLVFFTLEQPVLMLVSTV